MERKGMGKCTRPLPVSHFVIWGPAIICLTKSLHFDQIFVPQHLSQATEESPRKQESLETQHQSHRTGGILTGTEETDQGTFSL